MHVMEDDSVFRFSVQIYDIIQKFQKEIFLLKRFLSIIWKTFLNFPKRLLFLKNLKVCISFREYFLKQSLLCQSGIH